MIARLGSGILAASGARGILATARGPAVWTREMARLQGPWHAQRRGAGWLADLLAPPPRLRGGPLLGRALETLTPEPRPADLPTAGARRGTKRRRAMGSPEPGRPRRPSAPQPPNRQRGARFEPPARSVGTRASATRALPIERRRASRELLGRLAGADDAIVRRMQDPTRRPRTSWTPPAAGEAGTRSQRPYPERPDGRPGLASFAERVIGKLDRELGTRGRATAPSAATREMPAPGPAATALSGETAPGRLLERWFASDGGDASPRPQRSGRDSRSVERRPPPGPATITEGRVTQGRNAVDPPAAGVAAGSEPAGGGNTAASGPSPLSPGSRRNRAVPSPPVPAALATGPPASLLPATVADFDPSGTTARVLRGAARTPVAAAEDVGELAEKLGRHLAEEARRHGIDV